VGLSKESVLFSKTVSNYQLYEQQFSESKHKVRMSLAGMGWRMTVPEENHRSMEDINSCHWEKFCYSCLPSIIKMASGREQSAQGKVEK
jgi:hypothetical protein